jgi:cyanophycin synthetase
MKKDYVHTFATPNGIIEEKIPLSTKIILEEAERLGVSWEAIPNTRILKLQHQNTIKFFRYQISSETTELALYSCLDKGVTKAFLTQAGIETSKGYKLEQGSTEKDWLDVFQGLNKPVVVKPSHGFQGKSIFMDIKKELPYLQAVKAAFAFSQEEGAGVMVEEMFIGQEYRVLATHEKTVAVLYREPANVIGDGKQTIHELIDETNADPRRGSDLNYALFKIEIDEPLLQYLAEQDMSLGFVPAKNQKVFLRKVSNIAQGGNSIDVTDEVHPSVKEIAVQALKSIPGLPYAGVDFMTKDVTAPQKPGTYIVVEINSSPGICIHEFPFKGKPRHSEREFLFIMFPELKKTHA